MKSPSLVQPLPATSGHETCYPPLLEMDQSPSTPGATGERHPLLSLISACFWVIRESFVPTDRVRCPGLKDQSAPSVWLLKWFKSLVAFVTISIPRLIYSILSYSMTLTVSPVPTEFVTRTSQTLYSSTFGLLQ